MKTNMENDELKNAILTVVARFDLFDYPLNDFEVWQFLPLKASYQAVKANISVANLNLNDGLLFLNHRQNIINIRHTRYRETNHKINIIKQRLNFISWLPGIKLICLANVIGANNLKPNADIDLFIITKANRVWLVKLLATIILKIFALRPTDNKVKNKLCLSFLVDETALDLSVCRHNNEDWYFSYWLAGLMPLWGSQSTYEQLMKANSWLVQQLPNWRLSCSAPLKRFTAKEANTKLSKLGNYLETFSKKLHQKLMNQALWQNKNNNSGVIINDHLLKLHTIDRREYFFLQAQERISQLTLR